jgi:hypothetical protein
MRGSTGGCMGTRVGIAHCQSAPVLGSMAQAALIAIMPGKQRLLSEVT